MIATRQMHAPGPSTPARALPAGVAAVAAWTAETTVVAAAGRHQEGKYGTVQVAVDAGEHTGRPLKPL